MSHIEFVLLLQRVCTVALSGYNARFFFAYARQHTRLRLGALVLALVNLALCGESLAFSVAPALWDAERRITAAAQALASVLSLAVSFILAALVFRHKLRGKR